MIYRVWNEGISVGTKYLPVLTEMSTGNEIKDIKEVHIFKGIRKYW